MNGNIITEIGVGILVVGICVFIQGAILLALFLSLRRFFATLKDHFSVVRNFFVIVSLVWVMSLMHLVQVTVWAVAYVILGDFGDFYQAFYFSIVTLSTVGYGDLTAPDGWKVFGGIEALMGPLVFGWSASFLFGTVNRFYQVRATKFPDMHADGKQAAARNTADSHPALGDV